MNMTGDKKYYAVRAGHVPGVYTKWNECLGQIKGFKGAKFKSFSNIEDATLFMSGQDPSLDPRSSSFTAKFYGVRSGKVPGVYTDWEEAEKQIKGVTKPKVKSFSTIEEAQAFVADGVSSPDTIPKKKRPPEMAAEEALQTTLPPNPTQQDLPIAKRRKNTSEPMLDQEDTSNDPTPTRPRSPLEAGLGVKPSTPRAWMKNKSGILKIYTDGSALGNGKGTAQAGVGVWFGDQDTR